jgi:ParB family chromosome partitioning protein
MTSAMPTILELPVADIEVRADRLREVSEAKVLGLIELIELFGFTTPIEVRRAPKGRNILIDGAHRLEAMKRLGKETIPVRAFDVSDTDARGREIGANLVAGMTPLQNAVFLASWKTYHEELHPETKRGVAGALAKHGLQTTFNSFAEIAATSRGVAQRQIQKAIAAVKRLSDDEKRTLDRAEKPVSLDDIVTIGKIADADQRAQVVLRLASGNAKNAAKALAEVRAETAEPGPAKDPVDEAFKAGLTWWKRAPMAARRRMVAAVEADLRELLADLDRGGA